MERTDMKCAGHKDKAVRVESKYAPSETRRYNQFKVLDKNKVSFTFKN